MMSPQTARFARQARAVEELRVFTYSEEEPQGMRNIVASVVAGVLMMAGGMSGADLRLGNWKYNAAKSKTTSSNPIKNQIDVVEATPDGRVTTNRSGQLTDGTGFKYSFSYKYDGRDYPVKGAPFDMISVKRIDMSTTSFELSKTGNKYHMKGQVVISRDAQVKTITAAGTDAAGKAFTQTLVFNRF